MKLSKQIKKAIIIAGGILILTLITLAVSEWAVTRYRHEQAVYYSYNSRGSIGYRIYLKPNIIYDRNYLEENRYYILKYIDRIELELGYEYIGSTKADLKIEYGVTAYFQALHGADNEVLWKRDYILIPEKTDEGKYQEKTINKKTFLKPDYYNNLRETFFLDSEVNSPTVLNIVFDISTTAVTEHGTLEDVMHPELIIPIGESVFRIEGQPVLTGGKKIEETIRVPIPKNYFKIISLFVVSLALAALLVFVARMEESEPMDKFEKTISGIFKEYGERMAGMEHAISYLLTDVINVNCIEDMVKIADEVGQPVFYYKVDNSSERKIEFYVFDSNRIYYMVMFGEIKEENEIPTSIEENN